MKQQINKWLWPLLCLTLLLGSACSDDDTDASVSGPKAPSLTTDIPDNGYQFLYFKQEPHTFTMSVDAPWEITKTGGWFVVTPKQGKAGDRIVITIESDMNEGEARTGEFTIRANSGTYRTPCLTEKTVQLTQGAYRSAGFEIAGLEEYRDNLVTFPSDDPQPVRFTARASFDWTMTVSDNTWVTVAPLQGTAGQTVEVTVTPTPNTTTEPKTSELKLVCFDPENTENKAEVVVTLQQSRMADMHEVGYVFFEDDFNWITPLWDPSAYETLYGWPTVGNSDFSFYKDGANSVLGAKAAELGYTFNSSTYGRYLGFVKLGKTHENGLLLTPAMAEIDNERSATLLVQFDGAYYMTAAGTVDNGTAMSVSIVGGGMIVDAEATDDGRTLAIPMRSAFGWDRYSFLVKDATAATQIQFSDGVAQSNIKTRLFLDNVSITRADDDMAEAPEPVKVVEPVSAAVDPTAPADIDDTEQTLSCTIRVNRAWSLATDAEWLTITAVTSNNSANGSSVAADKRSATVARATGLLYNVTLQAAQNDGEARSATVTLTADGSDIGSVEVRQAKSSVTDELTIEGITDNAVDLGYDRTDENASVNLTVRSSLDWTAETEGTWYTVTPASGKGGSEVPVTITVNENNRGSRRFGKIVISTVKPAAGDALSETITVSQKPAGVGTAPWNLASPLQWIFSAEEKPKYTAEFSNSDENGLKGNTGNALPSETADGPGYISFAHNSTDLDVNDKCYRVVGSTGEPYVTGVWPGDYWMFTVPVQSLPAGTKVHFTGTSRCSGTGQKYWLMEYHDGSNWKPVSETKTIGTTDVIYTQEHAGSTALLVDFTVTFENAIANGNIEFRYTCVANAQANSGEALAAPNGGTHRWQAATGVVIEIVQ